MMTSVENAGVGPAEPELEMIARRARLLGPAYRLFYQNPVHVVRGQGVWLYGPQGEAYLDVYNNVACVGHCHPHVVAALSRQSGELNTHTRYLTDGILDYAERLLGTFPDGLDRVMFTCTGSEANDLACRVATAYTGRSGFIVTETAYHGVTVAVAAMSPSLGPQVAPGPNVWTVPPPDRFRSDGKDPGEVFAGHIRKAISEMEAAGILPAALLVDTIFSSDGVFSDPPGMLQAAAAAIRAAGGLFIADEVQPGFGRTGSGMWGFSRHGVVPDLATMGKPMGNGHPVAAMVARAELLEAFGKKARYFNTFGGNPVSCAVGMAVLDVIEAEGIIENAGRVGAYLARGLREIASRFPIIGEVRGAGLFIGVELVTDRETRTPATAETTRLVNALRDRRILITPAGPAGNVLKIRPPLVFQTEHADLFLEGLEAVLHRL